MVPRQGAAQACNGLPACHVPFAAPQKLHGNADVPKGQEQAKRIFKRFEWISNFDGRYVYSVHPIASMILGTTANGIDAPLKIWSPTG
jgi:hypothetical protein